MARERKPPGFILRRILFVLIALLSAFLCLSGALIALVICVDHVSEFFNGWNYENKWQPFSGNYFDFLGQLPGALYVAFSYFPEACFLSIIMYPMLAVALVIYEAVQGEFTLAVMGWAPFLAGVALFVFGGFNLLKGQESAEAGNFTKI